jgi:hypothetical protein
MNYKSLFAAKTQRRKEKNIDNYYFASPRLCGI